MFSPDSDDRFNKIVGCELSLEDLVKTLDTNLKDGLTATKVEHRLETLGKNEIQTVSPNPLKVYIAPLLDRLITIYLIMTFLLFILSIWYPPTLGQAGFWFIVIAFNMVIAMVQQFRAQKSLEALQNFSPMQSRVIRDGKTELVDTTELVPGDLIEFDLGDKVSADCRILTSSNLSVDEASLTGESIPARKVKDGSVCIDKEEPISSLTNLLFFGTYLITGKATAVVVRTGGRTEIGKIANVMADISVNEVPLRKRVNELGTKLGILVVLFLFLSVVAKLYQRFNLGQGFTVQTLATDISSSIIVAMSVLPINIPLLTTIILITGVLHMAKKNVIVKELSAIETLGRASVLCSDKTGTMTTSKMEVTQIWDTENYYKLKYETTGKLNFAIVDEKNAITDKDDETQKITVEQADLISPNSPLDLLVTAVTLNNDAQMIDSDDGMEPKISGNATDVALFSLGYRTKFQEKEARERYHMKREYPFDSEVKRMTKLFEDKIDQDLMVFSKGATEVILKRCTTIGNEAIAPPRKFKRGEKIKIKKAIDQFANQGYRVVSVAYRQLFSDIQLDDINEERNLIEKDLTYIGFACILDPPRPGVKNAVKKLDDAGIFPVMITGDALTTAATIATQVGIFDEDEKVIAGKDINDLNEEEFFKTSVFARVSPIDKQVIVEKYQKAGGVAVMTGDGVNDGIAIQMADVGIAMGITGTEVAKEAADIILADDSYVSLVSAVEEGRALYEKIRMVIFFYIAVNIAEGFVYFFTSLFPDFYLLNNFQRAYIFAIIHALPPLILILDKPAKDTMKLRPRKQGSIISYQLFKAMLVYSGALVVVLIIAFLFATIGLIPVSAFNMTGVIPTISSNADPLVVSSWGMAKARVYFITVIYITESLLILSIRRINQNIFESVKDLDKKLIIFFFIPLIGHVVIMYASGLQSALSGIILLDIIYFDLLDWVIVLLAAVIPIICLELFKFESRRQKIQF